MTRIYYERPISELPKESGGKYNAVLYDGSIRGSIVMGDDGWIRVPYGVTHWLEPSTLNPAPSGIVEENHKIKSALIGLVNVKIWKDKHGKDETYESLQPKAWTYAFDALGIEQNKQAPSAQSNQTGMKEAYDLGWQAWMEVYKINAMDTIWTDSEQEEYDWSFIKNEYDNWYKRFINPYKIPESQSPQGEVKEEKGK